MTHMPTQYLQIPSHLSQEDSHGNKSFPNAYSRRPYPLTPYPLTPYPSVPEAEHWSPSLNISSTELQRVLDSLLDQVDWLEVAVKVARNRAPSVYCKAIENLLLAHIYQLVKIEGDNDDAAQLENGIDNKINVAGCKGDDEEEDEDRSEFARENEDEDGDSDEDMEEDKDKDDEINDDEYDEDSESEYKE